MLAGEIGVGVGETPVAALVAGDRPGVQGAARTVRSPALAEASEQPGDALPVLCAEGVAQVVRELTSRVQALQPLAARREENARRVQRAQTAVCQRQAVPEARRRACACAPDSSASANSARSSSS